LLGNAESGDRSVGIAPPRPVTECLTHQLVACVIVQEVEAFSSVFS
jgi:hypothetical protein